MTPAEAVKKLNDHLASGAKHPLVMYAPNFLVLINELHRQGQMTTVQRNGVFNAKAMVVNGVKISTHTIQ